MFKNTYTVTFHFFHRCVFNKNFVDTGYRQLWVQLVGIFQQCLFVLAYLSSHIILPLPLLSMSFVFHKAVASPYPMTSSSCLPLYYPELQVSLACCLLSPCSSQSPGAVNCIALCVALNLYPFSLFSNPISSSNPRFFCCPVTVGTSPALHCLKCCVQIQQQCPVFLQVQCHLPQPL